MSLSTVPYRCLFLLVIGRRTHVYRILFSNHPRLPFHFLVLPRGHSCRAARHNGLIMKMGQVSHRDGCLPSFFSPSLSLSVGPVSFLLSRHSPPLSVPSFRCLARSSSEGLSGWASRDWLAIGNLFPLYQSKGSR